jgi:hypothetical protein
MYDFSHPLWFGLKVIFFVAFSKGYFVLKEIFKIEI